MLGKLISISVSQRTVIPRPVKAVSNLVRELHQQFILLFELFKKSKLLNEELEEAIRGCVELTIKIRNLLEQKLSSGIQIYILTEIDQDLKKLENLAKKYANWNQIREVLERICKMILSLEGEGTLENFKIRYPNSDREIEGNLNESLEDSQFEDHSLIDIKVSVISSSGHPIESICVSCGFFGEALTNKEGQVLFRLPKQSSFFLACVKVRTKPLFYIGKAENSYTIIFTVENF